MNMKKNKILCILLLLISMFAAQVSYAQKPVSFVHNGQLKKVQAFEKKGGDLGAVYDYVANNGQPVKGYLLNYAYAMKQTEIFEWLLEEIKKEPNYIEQLGHSLALMVDRADITTMKRFIELGADINSPCMLCNGNYPLLQALQSNNRDVIDYILSLHPNLHVNSELNKGVLHHTVIGGHYDLFMRFVEEDSLDIWEFHPEDNLMFYAARNNNPDILRYLVDRMITNYDLYYEFYPNDMHTYLSDEDGRMFLHYAAVSNPENIEIILGFIAKRDCPDNDGWTPLHYAAITSLENVKCLVNAHANVYAKENDGYGILHVACEFGMSDIVEYLLNDLNMDIDAETDDGYTPLMLAVSSGDLKTVKLICQYEDFNFFYRKNVLKMAKKHKDIFKYLKNIK